MNRFKGALAVFAMALGCTSIETGTLSGNEVLAAGGEPVAIVQVTTVGFSLFFGLVDVVTTDIEQTTKVLINEAKAMGGSRVEIKSAHSSPRHGVFKLLCAVACFPITEVVGVSIAAPAVPAADAVPPVPAAPSP